jgi:myo-inositol-1(or 4)-monophosphatase
MQDFLKQIIKEGGEMAMEYFKKGVSHSTKSHLGDLLTEADLAVNDFLLEKIREKYPDHKITSEERDVVNPDASEYEWVIDPIDGTRNFAMGMPIWGTLIAIMKDGEPYLAAVYNPTVDELYFAEKGKGSYLNDKQIFVNKTDSLDHAMGFCIRDSRGREYDEKFVTALKNLIDGNAWMHNFGTMVALCNLAQGGLDFFFTNSGQEYDYLAPVLICSEAGATVTDTDGNPWKRDRIDVVVANPNLYPKVMELFK